MHKLRMRSAGLIALEEMLRDAPSHSVRALRDYALRCQPGRMLLAVNAVKLIVSHAQAAIACTRALRERRHWTVADELRLCAEFTPEPNGSETPINLASWVGNGTREWYTVFTYSSPESAQLVPPPGKAHWPWFCQLDLEAQRFVLLLVAEAEETNSDS